jgi:hypothetical protein
MKLNWDFLTPSPSGKLHVRRAWGAGVMNNHRKPGTVTHTCNPSYSGDRQRLGGSRFHANPGKKIPKNPSQSIKAGCGGTHPCHPSYTGSVNERIEVQTGLGIT